VITSGLLLNAHAAGSENISGGSPSADRLSTEDGGGPRHADRLQCGAFAGSMSRLGETATRIRHDHVASPKAFVTHHNIGQISGGSHGGNPETGGLVFQCCGYQALIVNARSPGGLIVGDQASTILFRIAYRTNAADDDRLSFRIMAAR